MNKHYTDQFDWFDGWCEHHYELIEERNYPALVQHCLRRLERDPQDGHGIEALAEAYVLNGQYQESIDMLTPLYMADPEHPLYAHAILDALFGMGKRIEDFPWISKPKVLELSGDALDLCFDYLRPKRKPRSVSDLYVMAIMADGYVRFSEDELFQELIADSRFNVDCDCIFEAGISIVRKRKKTQCQQDTAQRT